jgi:hypothetical protein
MRGRLLLTRPREGADDSADFVARGQLSPDCGFNLAALHPAYPIKRLPSAQRTQASQGVENRKSSARDPLENTIDFNRTSRTATVDVAAGSWNAA